MSQSEKNKKYGRVVNVCTSPAKGTAKRPVRQITLRPGDDEFFHALLTDDPVPKRGSTESANPVVAFVNRKK